MYGVRLLNEIPMVLSVKKVLALNPVLGKYHLASLVTRELDEGVTGRTSIATVVLLYPITFSRTLDTKRKVLL